MDRLLTVIAVLSVVLIVLVLFSVRRAHIRVEYSVSWLFAALVVLLLSRFHWALDSLASVLQIDYAPLALVLVVVVIFLVVFYRFSMIISELKDSNIALTQKVAILEYQLGTLHEEHQARSS